MPELPTPDHDPITSKSYALHYLIATVLLFERGLLDLGPAVLRLHERWRAQRN